jgi:hypothetical protein
VKASSRAILAFASAVSLTALASAIASFKRSSIFNSPLIYHKINILFAIRPAKKFISCVLILDLIKLLGTLM